MQNKKLFVGLVALGVFLAVSVPAQASQKYNWKDHFSYAEMKSVKKNVVESVKDKFENDSDWKDVISGSNIKNGAIATENIKDSSVTVEKIKDGSVTTEKIKDGTIKAADVDSSIVKKKIYTGKAPSGTSGADKVTTGGSDGDEFYFKISIPEINISNMPGIQVFNTPQSAPDATAFAGMWKNYDQYYVEDGKIWVQYADNEGVGSTYVTDYKVVVQY